MEVGREGRGGGGERGKEWRWGEREGVEVGEGRDGCEEKGTGWRWGKREWVEWGETEGMESGIEGRDGGGEKGM